MTASLTITTERRQTHLWVKPVGELDQSTAALLFDRVLAGLLPTDTTVTMDLVGLTFCDSAGLGAMVRIHKRLADRDGRLTLVGPTPTVRRSLEITGLDTMFTVAPPVPPAAAG
jgi:anti-sigma B factor antagonist